jgi:hypothetical protein
MLSRLQVQIVAAVVVVVFAAGILVSGGKVESAWLKFYSYAVLVAVALLWLWEHWIWHFAYVQKARGVPRDIRGTWSGDLDSFWSDPTTGDKPATKRVFLVVRQTWSTVRVTLLTDESRSTSSSASLGGLDGEYELFYTYLNQPDNRIEHRSRMHHGSTVLQVVDRPATRLKGRYWTDRDSRGELDMKDRRSQVVEDYDTAVKLFNEQPGGGKR